MISACLSQRRSCDARLFQRNRLPGHRNARSMPKGLKQLKSKVSKGRLKPKAFGKFATQGVETVQGPFCHLSFGGFPGFLGPTKTQPKICISAS